MHHPQLQQGYWSWVSCITWHVIDILGHLSPDYHAPPFYERVGYMWNCTGHIWDYQMVVSSGAAVEVEDWMVHKNSEQEMETVWGV